MKEIIEGMLMLWVVVNAQITIRKKFKSAIGYLMRHNLLQEHMKAIKQHKKGKIVSAKIIRDEKEMDLSETF